MPTTTTGSLADSLPTMIDAARIVREHDGVFMRTTDHQRLPEGTGTTWDEISLAQLTGMNNIGEDQDLDNPQQLSDTLLQLTPVVGGIQTRITNRAKIRIDKKVAARLGVLAQNAVTRLKDESYLSWLDGATTSLSGTGTTLVSGVIGAAASRIKGNTTEPSTGELFTVLHPFQVRDVWDEVLAGIGTYMIPPGMTEQIFRKGFMGGVGGTNLFEDGNIAIDGSADSKGGVHSRESAVFVQGRTPWNYEKFLPEKGGGATDVFHYDEWVFGERSPGNWLYEVYSNTTAPTT